MKSLAKYYERIVEENCPYDIPYNEFDNMMKQVKVQMANAALVCNFVDKTDLLLT